jgi:hypothetical protein
MSKKQVGDNLAADAALAVEHTPEREAEQLAYFGGDVDEIDDFDSTGLDDGSDPNFVAPDPDDKDDEDADEDKTVDDEDDSGEPDAESDEVSDDDESADESEESSDDDAEEDDTGDDADEDDDAKPAAKGIPKRRFDEVNEEKKALRTENEQLRAQIEAGRPVEDQEEPFDFRAGEKEYMDLLLDGDTDAALAKREEIDAAKEAKWRSDAKTETKTELSSDAETQELISLSNEAQEMFDVFNPDSENYNQGMLNKVLTFMRGYESSDPDMSRGDAFVNGLADVVEMYNLMPEGEAAEEDDGKPKPTGKKKVDKKKAAVKKNAHQPVAGEGAASADAGAVVPDIETMTDEEIDALPAKTLARLRGDFV